MADVVLMEDFLRAEYAAVPWTGPAYLALEPSPGTVLSWDEHPVLALSHGADRRATVVGCWMPHGVRDAMSMFANEDGSVRVEFRYETACSARAWFTPERCGVACSCAGERVVGAFCRHMPAALAIGAAISTADFPITHGCNGVSMTQLRAQLREADQASVADAGNPFKIYRLCQAAVMVLEAYRRIEVVPWRTVWMAMVDDPWSDPDRLPRGGNDLAETLFG